MLLALLFAQTMRFRGTARPSFLVAAEWNGRRAPPVDTKLPKITPLASQRYGRTAAIHASLKTRNSKGVGHLA